MRTEYILFPIIGFFIFTCIIIHKLTPIKKRKKSYKIIATEQIKIELLDRISDTISLNKKIHQINPRKLKKIAKSMTRIKQPSKLLQILNEIPYLYLDNNSTVRSSIKRFDFLTERKDDNRDERKDDNKEVVIDMDELENNEPVVIHYPKPLKKKYLVV